MTPRVLFPEVRMFKNRNRLRKKLHEELYGQIPQMACESACSDCCCLVRFSRYEVAQIDTVRIICAVFKRFRQATTQKCPYVTQENRCSIYQVRPFVCRLFGTADHERLRCPKGLRPEKMLSAEEAERLINRFVKIIDL